MWFRKHDHPAPVNSVLNSSEFESLSKKMVDCSAAVSQQTLQLKILQTDVDNLRGLFNRKLKGLSKEEEKSAKEEGEETETNKKPSIFCSPDGVAI